MNVSGKISVFVEKKEGKNGNQYQTYSGSISHKHEDGTYTNAKIEIEFDSKFPYNDKLTQLKEKTAYQMEIKEGWQALGEITGTTASEDVVTRIFEKFCVGK